MVNGKGLEMVRPAGCSASRGTLLAALVIVLMIAAAMWALMPQTVHAQEDDDSYNTALFGAYCCVYGGGWDKSYFKEDEPADCQLMYYWTRAQHGLMNSSARIDLDDFVWDYAQETFTNCTGLREWLKLNSGYGKDYTYDEESGEIVLEPVYGGGGDPVTLEPTIDDIWDGSGDVYCSWMEGENLLQRAVIALEDGAIKSFAPEEKVYQVKPDPEIYDGILQALPGETLKIGASLQEYYQSDLIKPGEADKAISDVAGAQLRWNLDGQVIAENAASVKVIASDTDGNKEMIIEAFLPDADENADPVVTYRMDIGVSECKLGLTAREFGGPKISLSKKLSAGTQYMFLLDGATWGWDYGNTDGTPFYEWIITGPDKEAITIKQDAYEGGKAYSCFNDNSAVYGGGCPVRVLTFNVPGKYTIQGTIYRENKVFRTCSKTINVELPKVAVSKLTPGKKSFTVKWKKQAKPVSGYQITYALNKKFTKGAKTVNVGSAKTVSKTIKKLSAKKTYYVKIRAKAKINSKTYNGPWSAVKTVKTR